MYTEALLNTPLETMAKIIQEKNNYTTLQEMPEMYKQAVITVEDSRFYYHKGIDIVALSRAVINDLKTKSYAEGGSTITQQLAKNTYFTQEKKIDRKIAEAFMAIEYEKNFDKDQILELYLNTCYFGEGCYTVRDAARVYFDKLPIDMTDCESTMLAGIPNAPSVYAPTQNPELAKRRQRQVLSALVEKGVITLERAEEILNEF